MSQMKMEQGTARWDINGLSLPIDLEDADVMERYENAFEQMQQEELSVPKDGKTSARIRAYCKLYRDLYDRIFGEGTSDKIFAGQPTSAAVYEDVYDSFLTCVREQTANAAERRAERINKYRPANREQKHAVKRKK